MKAEQVAYCKCSFTDPDGTVVPGEPCPIHARKHVEAEDCWCCPTLDFVAENGVKVWVHHEPN